MSRFKNITNRGMAPIDLGYYCRFSWALCEKGEEIEKELEEMAKTTEDEWYDISHEYPEIMEEVLHHVEHMNKVLKEWYKYNEDFYNSVMCGAYYKDGEIKTTGRPQDYMHFDGFKLKDI